MTDCLQVATTVGSKDDAERLAGQLVERRLAACVQIVGPIGSVYHWQGAVESSQEWLCLAKTTAQKYEDLQAAIIELHSYDVPEILASPVVAGNPGYLEWLRAELSANKS